MAVADVRPPFTPRPEEVAELVELPLERLLVTGGISEEDITLPEVTLRTGVYRWAGHRVWGATARTLAMLGSALSAARPTP